MGRSVGVVPVSRGARRRVGVRGLLASLLVATVLLGTALGLDLNLLVSQVYVDGQLRAAAAQVVKDTASWPSPDKVAAWDAANKYNETIDPRVSSFDDAKSHGDAAYESALNLDGKGTMAALYIPRIGVSVPVFHGTGSSQLENGVGHMYGTSLPTGEPGTFSAIAGHSGSVHGLFFTSVPRLRVGDFIYVNVLGKQMGYRVDTLLRVLPNETDKLRALYKPGSGEARLTLITCVPVGVNTHRLLVSAVRVDDPPSPESQEEPLGGARVIIVASLIAGLSLLLLIVPWVLFIRLLIRRRREERNAAGAGDAGATTGVVPDDDAGSGTGPSGTAPDDAASSDAGAARGEALGVVAGDAGQQQA